PTEKSPAPGRTGAACRKYRDAGLLFRIIRSCVHEHADPPHALSLLRPRREGARSRTAEQRHERAPFHSITSSARATRVAGTSAPGALAALRLSRNSNLVGCCTGRSAGLAPLRMRST